ncbi:uncharacterized protein [Watersipora subatra]|uniref:uncharacterized protein n=1 Tax=Watersipora subatra TaxID=2589382 RepID=UPI00355B1FFA
MRYLGHIVSSERVATDPAKAEVVGQWPVPCGVRELQRFLGTVGYYRQNIPKFANIAKPLHWLVEREEPLRWTGEEQAAFDILRHSPTTAPMQGYLNLENTYIFDTDVGGCGVEAVLLQQYRDQKQMMAYYSKTLTPCSKITV